MRSILSMLYNISIFIYISSLTLLFCWLFHHAVPVEDEREPLGRGGGGDRGWWRRRGEVEDGVASAAVDGESVIGRVGELEAKRVGRRRRHAQRTAMT